MVTDLCAKLGYFLLLISYDGLSCKYQKPQWQWPGQISIYFSAHNTKFGGRHSYFTSEGAQGQGSGPRPVIPLVSPSRTAVAPSGLYLYSNRGSGQGLHRAVILKGPSLLLHWPWLVTWLQDSLGKRFLLFSLYSGTWAKEKEALWTALISQPSGCILDVTAWTKNILSSQRCVYLIMTANYLVST